MKNPKNCTNILLVGLEKEFCRSVAEELSAKLQMHFASCEELVAYHVQERELILERVGLDYLKKKEKTALAECAGYMDTVLSIGFELFKNNFKLFTQSVICYLRLEKEKIKDIKSKIAYDERDQFLQKNCHFKIDLTRKDKQTACKKIIEILGEKL